MRDAVLKIADPMDTRHRYAVYTVANDLNKVVDFDAASHMARVETHGGVALRGTVTDPAAAPAVGEAVTVAVRPEHLRVDAADSTTDTADGWTRIPGRISQGTYLGDQTEYRIQTDQAGELVVRRQNQLGETTGHGLGPGDPVAVRWHEAANLILVG